jgi:Bacterial SH3 domain
MRFVLGGLAAAMVSVACASSAFACGGPPICTVKDPTGTPLNVRLSPKGKILMNIKNGQQVEIIDHQEIGGKRWARVGKFSSAELASDEEGGWVFASYLTCNGSLKALPNDLSISDDDAVACTVTDPTGTPLNVRGEPGGAIYATLRNGTIVRASRMTTRKGKPWVYVAKWSVDNAIGWVFDPYLRCEEDQG